MLGKHGSRLLGSARPSEAPEVSMVRFLQVLQFLLPQVLQFLLPQVLQFLLPQVFLLLLPLMLRWTVLVLPGQGYISHPGASEGLHVSIWVLHSISVCWAVVQSEVSFNAVGFYLPGLFRGA